MKEENFVLVTGGCGFIGSHLVDLLLAQGHKVRVLDDLSSGRLDNLLQWKENPNLEFIQKDIRSVEPDATEFKSVSHVFHLAGIGDIVPSIENPEKYLDVNIQGTVKVLEASRRAGVKRVVYAASSSCYGLAETPTDEATPVNPLYPYALSKYLAEQVLFHWQRVYKISVNSICIFNAYGPRVKTKGAYGAVLGVFFKQRLEGKPLTIVGDGSQKRDFVHVRDVAKAFLLAGQTKVSGERFNIGAGKPISINQLAEIIGGEKVFIPNRPGEPQVTFANIQKARDLLGWTPTIEFQEGIKEMLAEIDLWRDAPLWDIESIAKSTETWFKFMGEK